MTEEEAKTKWCPLARLTATNDKKEDGILVSSIPFSANRFPDNKYAPCIGSACMAWREITHQNGTAYKIDAAVKQFYGGYCGAFGKP